MWMHRVLLAVTLCLFGSSAHASTIIGTFPASYSNLTGGWKFVGQSFTVPLIDTLLTQWEFDIAGRTTSGNIDFSIREWNGTIGAVQYSTTISWSTSSGVIVLGGLGVGLNPGQSYIAIYDLLGYGGSSLRYGPGSYSGGQGTWGGSLNELVTNAPLYAVTDLDTSFQATFESQQTAVPEPATLLLFGSGLAAIAHRRLRNRRR
jgi:hypothetical protein